MDTTLVKFGEWLPDQPSLQNAGTINILNVIPAFNGYRSFPSLVQISDSLTTECLGCVSIKYYDDVSASMQTDTFAGDTENLYRLGADYVWDVVNSPYVTYTTDATNFWSFADFSGQMMATNYNDAPQYFDGTNFVDLSAGAPKGKYIAVIKDSVFLGFTNDSVDGVKSNRVWWSGYGLPRSWPVIGSDQAYQEQSDFQDLPNGGVVTGFAGAVGGADGLVFKQNAIYRVAYEGIPTVYGFYQIENSKGCVAPRSIANNGSVVFFLSEDGFYACNGASVQSIGNEKVDRWFYNNVNALRLEDVTSSIDYKNKIVCWAFPSINCPDSIGADCLILFNWVLNRWSKISTNLNVLVPSFTQATSTDSASFPYASTDAMDVSTDSRIFAGGRLIFSAIDTENKLSFFEGNSLEAIIETGEINGDNKGNKVFISGIRPLIDSGDSSVAVGYRNLLTESRTYSNYTDTTETGIAPQRVSSRYATAIVKIDAGANFLDATGCEVRIQKRGAR